MPKSSGGRRTGIALPAALAALLAALAVGGGCAWFQKRLQQLPRAHQPASDWMEDSAARNQGRIRILASTPQRLDVQLECRPSKPGSLPGKSCSLPPHAHAPPITEWLTVREGRMGYLLNGTEGVATAESGSIRTDPGFVHTFWNADPEKGMAVVATYSPPGAYERFFQTIAGLGTDYGSYDKVPVLQWMTTFDAVGMRHGNVPPLVWEHVVRRAVVPLAKLAGFRAFDDEYAGATAAPTAATTEA